MASDHHPEIDRLVQEALASRKPDPPDSGEIEIYDEDTGWIRPDEPSRDGSGESDPTTNPTDR